MPSRQNILQFVRDRLGRDKDEWERAAKGSGVSYYTIRKIATGLIKEPGVIKIQKLYNFYERRSDS